MISSMDKQMNEMDAKLLEELQRVVPMVARPYRQIGERLGISEADVISRIIELRKDGIIRQISAIFDSAALGYTSALVAFSVKDDMLDAAAETIAEVSGVSHCYARRGKFNLWFTVTVEPGLSVADAVAPLASLDGVQAHLLLPATRVFKVGVFLKMTDGEAVNPIPARDSNRKPIFELTPEDKETVCALQQDLPAVERPFDELAKQVGMSVEELLSRGQKLMEQGAMRRFAAVLRHRSAGYKSNAMVCWRGDSDTIARIGPVLADNPSVSHCYERETYPEWPYGLYTMVHARSEAELEFAIKELSEAAGLTDYLVLHTQKEYKKSRVVYFA
ncbi:MAG: AsnC family transcriptional regulator [Armatimonadetes bacterium]|nr:AsnC family transcriptional regulator [Armatimonadota bacterium]